MRFLFITPRPTVSHRPLPHWLPLGFPYIGSVLRAAGHEVCVFDRYARLAERGMNRERLDAVMLDFVRQFAPDVIGLGTLTPLIAGTAQIAVRLRQVFDGMLLAGGHHASALPALTLERIPELDGIVEGEGEWVLQRLGAGEPLTGIPGLWCRNGCEIKGSPPLQVETLDDLPFPDLSLFDMNFYTRPGSNLIRGHFLSTVSLLTSRGCSRRCSFCTESLTYGKGVRFHSISYVTDMVEKTLRELPQVQGIYFHDNDFMIDRERVASLCEAFIRRGLHQKFGWAVQARVDRLDSEILSLMRRAGCIALELGVEASSQSVLNQFGKGATVDQNLTAIRLCKEQGLSVHAYMLTEVPGETLEDLDMRLEWLKMAAPNTFQWSPLKIYPGSLMYETGAGKEFFRTAAWTEEEVGTYFQTDFLSGVGPSQRDTWMKRHYEPYNKRHHRWNKLRVNPCRKWPPMLGSKFVRLWQHFIDRFAK